MQQQQQQEHVSGFQERRSFSPTFAPSTGATIDPSKLLTHHDIPFMRVGSPEVLAMPYTSLAPSSMSTRHRARSKSKGAPPNPAVFEQRQSNNFKMPLGGAESPKKRRRHHEPNMAAEDMHNQFPIAELQELIAADSNGGFDVFTPVVFDEESKQEAAMWQMQMHQVAFGNGQFVQPRRPIATRTPPPVQPAPITPSAIAPATGPAKRKRVMSMPTIPTFADSPPTPIAPHPHPHLPHHPPQHHHHHTAIRPRPQSPIARVSHTIPRSTSMPIRPHSPVVMGGTSVASPSSASSSSPAASPSPSPSTLPMLSPSLSPSSAPTTPASSAPSSPSPSPTLARRTSPLSLSTDSALNGGGAAGGGGSGGKKGSAASASADGRKRHRKTAQQLTVLESHFAVTPTPNKQLREALALQLGLTSRQVQIWFQNKRAKRKQERLDGDVALGGGSPQPGVSSPRGRGRRSNGSSPSKAAATQQQQQQRKNMISMDTIEMITPGMDSHRGTPSPGSNEEGRESENEDDRSPDERFVLSLANGHMNGGSDCRLGQQEMSVDRRVSHGSPNAGGDNGAGGQQQQPMYARMSGPYADKKEEETNRGRKTPPTSSAMGHGDPHAFMMDPSVGGTADMQNSMIMRESFLANQATHHLQQQLHSPLGHPHHPQHPHQHHPQFHPPQGMGEFDFLNSPDMGHSSSASPPMLDLGEDVVTVDDDDDEGDMLSKMMMSLNDWSSRDDDEDDEVRAVSAVAVTRDEDNVDEMSIHMAEDVLANGGSHQQGFGPSSAAIEGNHSAASAAAPTGQNGDEQGSDGMQFEKELCDILSFNEDCPFLL